MKEPKIRFKGFRGEWERAPLLDVVTLYNGLTYTPNDIRDHGTLVLRSSNVQEGEISLFDNVYVRSEVANSPNVKKGDIIVVVRNGSRTLIGKHAQIKSDMPNTVIGAFMAGMHTDEPEFLNALLSTSRFDNEVTINLGATINQITNGTFHSMKFLFPNKKEQKALGSYFQHLDSVIQSTTKKIESLKQVKAASLQSMFPQEGETTPRVRFKGFEGEWEKVKLGDVLTYEQPSKYLVTNTEYEKSGIPVLTAGKTFVLGYTSDTFGLYTNLPVIIFDDFTTESKFVDFLFKAKSSAMKMLNTAYDLDVDIKFIYETMKNIQYRVENHQRHWLSIFSKITIKIPSISEQRTIASYFTNLDRQISLQGQRLEKLKQIKAACLDKMFV